MKKYVATAVASLLFAIIYVTNAYSSHPVVLFDQGHGQRFLIEETGPLHLSSFAKVFESAGYEVRASKEKLTKSHLEGVSVIVTSGAFAPYGVEELALLENHLKEGGSVAVLIHIPMTVNGVLSTLGVMASNGVLNKSVDNIGGVSTNFPIHTLRVHPINEGLEYFNLYGGWALLPTTSNAGSIANTGKSAWMDVNRNRLQDPNEPTHAYDVVVAGTLGKGRFVVFGDDAIFQNKFLEGPNAKLAENLAKWLVPPSWF